MIHHFYVYMHVNLKNSEPFYVGKGSNKRAYSHSRRSKMWKYTVNKYGGFGVVFLGKFLSEIESFELEKHWIDKIGRRDKGNGTLINFTDGGPGFFGLIKSKDHVSKISKNRIGVSPPNKGVPMSQEQKDKISKSCMGRIGSNKKRGPMSQEQKDKISKATKGKVVSLESRKKISIGHKGKKLSKEHKEKLSKAKKGKVTWNKGIPMSEETRAKLIEALRKKRESK